MAINGKRYSYENVSIAFAGKVVAACDGINYKETTEHEEIKVLGKRSPHAIVDKGASYEGEVMLVMDEFESLQRSIPKGASVTQIAAFDITIVWQAADGSIMTDRLKQCRIKEVGKEFKAGELFSVISLPISIGLIEYNV